MKFTLLSRAATAAGLALSVIAITNAQPIRITGSDTADPILVAASDQFAKSNPNVKFSYDIKGSSQGFATLCDGRADIALASRKINDREIAACKAKGVVYTEVPLAWDAIVVIANKNDGWLRDISLAELRKIWGSDATQRNANWNEIRPTYPSGRINLAGLDTKSGSREFFATAVTGNAASLRADYPMFADHYDVIAAVAKTPGTIGFTSMAFYQDRASQVAVLAVDFGRGMVIPTAQAVTSDQYDKFSRLLYAYVARPAYTQRAEVREFVDYVMSGARRFVQYARFIPLTERNYQDAAASVKVGR